jgi:hypothetical protein
MRGAENKEPGVHLVVLDALIRFEGDPPTLGRTPAQMMVRIRQLTAASLAGTSGIRGSPLAAPRSTPYSHARDGERLRARLRDFESQEASQ